MVRSLEAGVAWPWGLTEPRLRRVLMLCFPLSPSSSSLTGLNINGGGSTGFSIGGSSPYFLKWMRQSVHSRMFSRPPWCQSLEAAQGKRVGAEPQNPISLEHLGGGLTNPGATRACALGLNRPHHSHSSGPGAALLSPRAGEGFRNFLPHLSWGTQEELRAGAPGPTSSKSVLCTDQHLVMTAR